MPLTRAEIIQNILDTIYNNNLELITGQIGQDRFVELAQNSLNLLTDRQLLGLRIHNTSIDYDKDQACLHDTGEGLEIFVANKDTTGTFNISDWDRIIIRGNQILDNSIDLGKLQGGSKTLPANSSLSTDKTNFTDNEFITKSYVDAGLQNVFADGLKVFYVDSNNENDGDGSVLNPFRTIDFAYNKAVYDDPNYDGQTTNFSPDSPAYQGVTIIVASGNYFTYNNLIARDLNYNFAIGANLTYLGTDYLFNLDSITTQTDTEIKILGDVNLVTNVGGFVKAHGFNSNSRHKQLTLELYDATSNVVNVSNPLDKILFDVSEVNGWWQPLKLSVKNRCTTVTQTIINVSNRALCEINGNNTGVLGMVDTIGDKTVSLVRIQRTQNTTIKNIWLFGIKNEGMVRIEDNAKIRDFLIENVSVNGTGSSSFTQPEAFLKIGSNVSVETDGGGSGAYTTFILNNVRMTNSNFSNEYTILCDTLNFNRLEIYDSVIRGKISDNINITLQEDHEGNKVSTVNTIDNNLTLGYVPDNFDSNQKSVWQSDSFLRLGEGKLSASEVDLSDYATTVYVNNKVADLVDSAPATLDTLNELAQALGDDPNFATTVTNQLASKASLTYVDDSVSDLASEVNTQIDTINTTLSGKASKNYVDTNFFSKNGGSLNGELNMFNHIISFTNSNLDGSDDNIDHIWYDDVANAYHFVSDSSYKVTGNAAIYGGDFFKTDGTKVAYEGHSHNDYLPLSGGAIDGNLTVAGTSAELKSSYVASNYARVKVSSGNMAELYVVGSTTSSRLVVSPSQIKFDTQNVFVNADLHAESYKLKTTVSTYKEALNFDSNTLVIGSEFEKVQLPAIQNYEHTNTNSSLITYTQNGVVDAKIETIESEVDATVADSQGKKLTDAWVGKVKFRDGIVGQYSYHFDGTDYYKYECFADNTWLRFKSV